MIHPFIEALGWWVMLIVLVWLAAVGIAGYNAWAVKGKG